MGDGNTRLIYFLVNAALVVLAFGAVVAIVSLFGDSHLSVEAIYPRDEANFPAGVSLRENPKVTLDVADPSGKQKLLSFGTAAVQGILIALGLWLLRGLAASVKKGDPFGWENVKRLRRLGVLLVLGAPLGALAVQSLQLQLVSSLPSGRYGHAMAPSFDLPVGVMLAGVGAFILGEVFAYGVRLREDVEATI